MLANTQLLQCGDGGSGVICLMQAEQRGGMLLPCQPELRAVDGTGDLLRGLADRQRYAQLLRTLRHHTAHGIGIIGCKHAGAALLENACFFKGDLLNGVAQISGMIQRYRGNDGQCRVLHHVGGVKASAHAHLQHHKIGCLLLIHEGSGGDKFKFRQRHTDALCRLLNAIGGSGIILG